MEENRVTVELIFETREEAAASRAQREQFARNRAWLQEHILEIGERHRGKVVGVAGEELFVGEDVYEVMALAKVAHPDDTGLITRYIPKQKYVRIYALPR